MNAALSKVPQVTLGFWIIKILATTLGETGGDALSMSANLGYLLSTVIFMAAFAAAVAAQIAMKAFNPALYWLTIIASTTVGTTMADFADRSLGIGYAGGSMLLVVLLALAFLAWRRSTGTLDVGSVFTPRSECYYWFTIMLSQTLGTALGDWTADSIQLGYTGAALVFGGLLLLVLLAYWWTRIPHTALFWAAFVLTRPLGAVVGDYLDKPVANGGLAFSRYTATTVLLAAIVALIAVLPQRAAQKTR